MGNVGHCRVRLSSKGEEQRVWKVVGEEEDDEMVGSNYVSSVVETSNASKSGGAFNHLKNSSLDQWRPGFFADPCLSVFVLFPPLFSNFITSPLTFCLFY